MRSVLVPILLVTTYLLGLGVGAVSGASSADLVAVVVVAVALARGSVAGAGTGFVAGLLLDLAPGSTFPVGTGALAGTTAGALLGALSDRAELGARQGPMLSGPSVVGRGMLAAGVTAVALSTQFLVRNGVGMILGVSPYLVSPELLVPAAGTLLVAALVVPGLTALFATRRAG